jgi:hypothetical protein
MMLSVAFFYTLIILKDHDTTVMSEYQYTLEKRSYLVVTMVWMALLAKIALLPFFTYTLDELSTIIPGAMCAAGVVGSNGYGAWLLGVKIIVIILALLWIVLDREDQHLKSGYYFKKKMFFFLAIFALVVVEFILEILFLSSLSTQNPVLCCSVIYKESSKFGALPFSLGTAELVGLFYAWYGSVMVAVYYGKKRVLLFSSLLFVGISYYAIVYFFSTYVYELPSHQCPFCLLQSEYYSIGYAIFASLIIATFYALAVSLFPFMEHKKRCVMVWYTVFMMLTSWHFLVYIVTNGVLL